MNVDVNREVKLNAELVYSLFLIKSLKKSIKDFHVCDVCVCCSATLLAFLVELLKSSVAMQEQMLGGKGFLVIGYLLEKVSKRPQQ